ncbi:tautomerase family protein [Pseudooceanicola sp. MF1-13]|uniref:tautomerase family protein n=1 Tax=Pseudooceanicola sp. MF1-13 TaxID=3379095 RepID=UPI003892B1B7
MPLVRIDLIRGRSKTEVTQLCDTLHACVVEAFGVPAHDRFQIVTQHETHEMIIQDVGLGFDRSDQVIVIQITTTPRSLSARKTLFALIAKRLQSDCGIRPEDVMINLVPVSESDWSFGMGQPQFLTGAL